MTIRFYEVGGSVRNHLLNQVNGNDVDYVVTGTDIDGLRDYIAGLGGRIFLTDTEHGTVRAVVAGRSAFDYTLARNSQGGFAHGTLATDAMHRDFTFNAMMLDEQGTLFDYVNGERDLREGVIRPVNGVDTMRDDPVRAVRAIRFQARYRFSIFAPLSQWMHNRECVELLETQEVERVRAEFGKIFACGIGRAVAVLAQYPNIVGVAEEMGITARVSQKRG